MTWFERILRSDSANARIRTIVVGMHEALPESLSKSHSMDQSEGGTKTGLRVYADLLKVQNEKHKRVYVLASHSHYFMDGIFKTEYWRAHGGVLPGWIVGTAGAVRYALPPEAVFAHAALTDVYGFLAGTVHPDGRIQFDFQRLNETDVPASDHRTLHARICALVLCREFASALTRNRSIEEESSNELRPVMVSGHSLIFSRV